MEIKFATIIILNGAHVRFTHFYNFFPKFLGIYNYRKGAKYVALPFFCIVYFAHLSLKILFQTILILMLQNAIFAVTIKLCMSLCSFL